MSIYLVLIEDIIPLDRTLFKERGPAPCLPVLSPHFPKEFAIQRVPVQRWNVRHGVIILICRHGLKIDRFKSYPRRVLERIMRLDDQVELVVLKQS